MKNYLFCSLAFLALAFASAPATVQAAEYNENSCFIQDDHPVADFVITAAPDLCVQYVITGNDFATASQCYTVATPFARVYRVIWKIGKPDTKRHCSWKFYHCKVC